MANQDRINQIKSMLIKNPQDNFLLFALGLEYKALKDYQKAADYFDNLMQVNPHYGATYYQYAETLIQLNHLKKAYEIAKLGIAVHQEIGDTKTINELEFLIEDIEDLIDEQ